ncbi:hypothetical protein [Actinomadura oligospora]|uniref:hypothetical protein n=1 Tax=Actinomadura oligospora TaxID=111804 RepID=UPI00047D2760|nr:hypothetical protein [Actinomadura oligospora]
MIPQLVTVGYRRSNGRRRRLFLPVLPLVLLVSPLLLFAVLAGLVACLIFRVSPTAALLGIGRVLWALPGASFELEEGTTAFLVSVR